MHVPQIVVNSLISMYGECGDLEKARSVSVINFILF